MNITGDKTSKGGFILGTTVAQYEKYISKAYCMAAEEDGSLTGFGIIIPDDMLRETDVWTKRSQAKWFVGLDEYETIQLCYFEQLAFLPGRQRLAIKLAYQLVKQAFEDGAEALFTTTVNKPILNMAAIPFIKAAHGIHAGNIDELYPVFGQINSDIYIIRRGDFYESLAQHPIYTFLEQQQPVL